MARKKKTPVAAIFVMVILLAVIAVWNSRSGGQTPGVFDPELAERQQQQQAPPIGDAAGSGGAREVPSNVDQQRRDAMRQNLGGGTGQGPTAPGPAAPGPVGR